MSDDDTPAPDGAYRVLARKYRPTRFGDLIGQDALVRVLTNAFGGGRLAQAYLLTGVRGVGKTTTARLIARALNCVGADGARTAPEIEPCGECDQCRAIAADRHVDVLEMDAASRTGVDDIRELIDGVRYAPTMGRCKVYIIDEVHMLSVNAFNALLKTLEEPPAHVTFVFATTEPRKIPVTVVSRCQRFDLRRVETTTLAAHFAEVAEKEAAKVQAGALALIARAADGSVRDGLSILDQAISTAAGSEVSETLVRDMLGLADRAQIYDLFECLMSGDVAGGLDRLGDQYRAGADPVVVLQDLLEITHWLTRLRLTPEAAEDPGLPEAARDRGRALSAKLDIAETTRCWQILLKGLQETQVAARPLQAAEMVLVRLAHAAALPSPADLVRQLDGAPAKPATAAGQPARAPASAKSGQAKAEAAMAVPAVRADPAHATEPTAAVMPSGFEDAVQLFASHRQMVLYAHLLNDVHLVRFEPGHIEIRVEDRAPADLASQLGNHLTNWTGQRWVVAVSREQGMPTLSDQRAAQIAARKESAAADPLVRQLLAAFPDAEITDVRGAAPDATADAPSNAADKGDIRQ